ncbi:MAG: hypothetical protein WA733_21175 [Methylocystis sp.]
MNRISSQYQYMSLDDFEELLADKPADEKWELLGGRVVRMMVGARWEHNRIVQNMTTALMNDFRRRGSDCLLRLPAIDFELPLAEIYRDVIAPTS